MEFLHSEMIMKATELMLSTKTIQSSFVNQIWVCEICKSLYSVFMYNLHSVSTILEFELYSDVNTF